MTRLCKDCNRIRFPRRFFNCEPFLSTAHTSTFGQLRSTRHTCDFCSLIAKALERDWPDAFPNSKDADPWNLIWNRSAIDYQPLQESENRPCALYPVRGRKDESRSSIQPIFGKDSAEVLRGRHIDSTIETSLLRGWIDRCKTLHGKECRAPRPLDMRLRVVDTKRLCLVDLPKGEEYTTLSYVWGTSNFVTTLTSNEHAFQQPGGLGVIKLPQTIHDSIEVTKALNLRYLWVDSLCITQDDTKTKMDLIGSMDKIYSNAGVTLVAATGNGADSGLSGWSNRLGRNQHCIDMDGLRLGLVPNYTSELERCEHSQRAWT